MTSACRVLGAWGGLDGVSLGVDKDLKQAGRALVCGCAAAIVADARAVRARCGRGACREDEREERGERRRSHSPLRLPKPNQAQLNEPSNYRQTNVSILRTASFFFLLSLYPSSPFLLLLLLKVRKYDLYVATDR